MRIIVTVLLPVSLLMIAASGWADEGQPKQAGNAKQTVLEISRDTTRITKPLDKRGFVDYLQATNQLVSQGVTPENNFENVVRQVMGPKEIAVAVQEEYHRRLKMEIPQGPFLGTYFDFQRGADDATVLADFEAALEQPWSDDDLPEMARWLDSERDRVNALVEGSKRSRFYAPYIASDADEDVRLPQMIAVLLPSIQGMRHIARTLAIRVNRNIAAGDLDAAWRDVQAMQRISRLCAQGVTLVESLVGIAIDGIAFQLAETVLKSPALTDAQLTRFRADLEDLPHLPAISTKIDVGERWCALDALQVLASQGDFLKSLQLIQDLTIDQSLDVANGTMLVVQRPKPKVQPQAVAPILVNWNVTAKNLNQWYDRLVAASAEEFDPGKRQELFAQIDRDLEKARQNSSGALKAIAILFAGKPKDELGRMFSDVLAALLLPAVEAVCQAQFEAAERLEVLRCAYAAEAFKRQMGDYPKQIDELVPQYLKSIPVDRFSGKPLVYRPLRSGFVLYSLGRNGADDLGRGYNDRGERERVAWDDVVIRMKSSN